jgi:hypothetical protein
MSGLHRVFLCFALSTALLGLPPADGFAEEPECASCDRIRRDHPDVEIGEIRIIHKDIFEPEDELPAHFPWRTLNRLHMNTKEWVIRRELLFEEGDRLNPDLVREVLRNLRGLDYFRDDRIECALLEPGKVRIDVYLRENWSLIPIFGIQGVDTAQAVTLGVTEQNFLGRGKSLSAWGRKGAEARNTFIEDSWGVRYVDPNIMGSWYRFAGTIQGLETGEFLQAIAEHPFYSLETPWSASLFGQHFRRERRLIRNGEIASVFEQEDNTSGIDFSFALRRGPPVVHRIGPFYEYTQKRVKDYRIVTAEGGELEPPPDDTTSSVGIAYRRLGVDYIVEERIYRFDRREDFNMANDLNLSAAFSAELLGADADEWIFSLSDVQGHSFRKGNFLFLNASAQGIWDGDRVRNGLFLVGYDHYLQDTFLDGGPFLHTLHWLGSFGYGTHLDPDRLFGLGYPNGLRGYSRDAFTGDKKLLFSVEDRIFFAENLFRLVALGVLIFFDTGFVWDEGQSVDLKDLRYAVGTGLRVALPSVAGVNVLQLTWGFPLGSGVDPFGDSVFTIVTSTGF